MLKMSSCSNPHSTKVGYRSNHSALPSITNMSECNENSTKPDEEEEEDEEEDIDFNPFLKETPSPEASSSLSSEIEGLDGDAVDSGKNIIGTVGVDSSKLTCEVQNCAGGPDHGEEEVVMQTIASSEGTYEKEFPNNSTRDLKKRVSTLLSPIEGEIVQEKGNISSSGIGVNDVKAGESGTTTDSQKCMIVLDDEDAICRRTRARYSLASFTLDELETFLQETDDEDDLQNVDDEEEYRKFLAAVLLGGDSGGQSTQEIEIADDDEDNDADFEIELEEALESDIDERRDKTEEDYEIGGRRPETRQNSRKKSSSQCKKKFLAQTKRPLRPLLPVFPYGPISSFPTPDGKAFMPETASNCLSSPAQDGYINGFTPHQIGQLHCLIHEHVQLLIQVFSLCAFDSSRLHIASQVQKLIFEMLHKRSEVLAWKSVSYPSRCFCTPYVFSSVPNDVPEFFPIQCTLESSPSYTANEMCSSNNQVSTSENVSSSKVTCDSTSKSQAGSFRKVEGSFWVPYISGPVLTILDVAPLSLVGNYMNEVENAVQESRRRHLESSCDTRFEREPLFPLPSFPLVSQSNCEVSSRTTSSTINTVSPSSSQQPPKKTLAATLVENTKKQSVALVPREISKLSQRFFPLFNPALFPHKPPPAAHANRVLFTDAEDELLALGLMEYNTDWKAIQQRFLPCKSKHQIFVRQKNRCSSKAPENPIKAVRRMKTSPLTTEELACIQEGLKVFKYNWMSVWQFVVPHRDPSLLPRQWRVALGTQKSYKLDAAKREKRRLYESKRRKCKIADSSIWRNEGDCHAENSGGENNTADDYIDNSGKTYVHEAFLADWRPNTSNGHPHGAMLSQEQLNNYGPGEVPQSQLKTSQDQIPSLSKSPRHPSFHSIAVKESGPGTALVNNSVSSKSLGTSKSQFHLRPYRARRTNGAHLVKLAPDLPPVNLPPSARILPQSAFKGSLSGATSVISAHGSGIGDAGTQNVVSRIPHDGRFGITHAIKYRQENSNLMKDSLTSFHAQESRIVKEKCTEEERNIDSDLQMHPLLFQTPEDGQQPYYPLNYNTTNSSSFSFFSGNQPQLNLSLLHNPHQENHVGSCTTSLKPSTSRGIDFHPLLQRTDYLNSDSVSACSTAQLSVGSGGKYNQVHSSLDARQNKSLIDGNQLARGLNSSSDERGKEVNLEIQLSSTSRKGKARGRDVTHNSVKSIITAADSGAAVEAQDNSSLFYQHAENSPSNSHMLVSGGHTLVVPSNNSGRYVDDMGDQSLPEIVMEQEELSDSDEENEENVEFECEEMADSEGEEGSGCEQLAEVKAKDTPRSDCGAKQCESSTDFNSQGTVHIPGKEIPSLELGLTSQAKDAACKSSWLSLHSAVPDHPLHMMRKHDNSLIGEGDATKNLASCRPSRSCKKTKPSTKEVTTQKQALNMEQQLSLGPLAIPIMRKPRKHACRNNTSSTID